MAPPTGGAISGRMLPKIGTASLQDVPFSVPRPVPLGSLQDVPFSVPRPVPLGSLRSSPKALTASVTLTPRREHGAAPAWPAKIERAAVLAVKPRRLLHRGALFEFCVVDAAEPRRSGQYQFLVVGLDLSEPGQPRYHAWEPTGHFDRTFSVDEVEKQLASEMFRKSLNMTPRSDVGLDSAHRKDGLRHASAVVRWPDPARGQLPLPEMDERGRPILPYGCRFPARNSTDVLRPALLHWKNNLLSRCPVANDQQPQVLVLDCTGRFAAHVQDEIVQAQVVAVNDARHRPRLPLRSFRERRSLGERNVVPTSHFPVDGTALSSAEPTLRFPDNAFDVVWLPFVLRRLCGGEPERLWALLMEALRVSAGHVVLAEDVAAPLDLALISRWKTVVAGKWSSPVLLDKELPGGPVPDHFLSGSGSDAAAGLRRFLVIDASNFHYTGYAP